MGMSAWKKAKSPAMPHILRVLILGSLRPFARETANASMASPTPSMMLVKKKLKSGCILITPLCYKKSEYGEKPYSEIKIKDKIDSMHSFPVIHESRNLKQARPKGQYVDLLRINARYSLMGFSSQTNLTPFF